MLSRLVGNERAKRILRRLIQTGRIPNSLLLSGDEGIGKRQFAIEIARSFVCREPSDDGGCGVCLPCERAARFELPERDDKNKDDFKKVIFSNHIDVGLVTNYKRLILVDAIRDLERQANFRPYEAGARFFIIDDAHKMNDEASNALLKTLEEPPATTHIILVTSHPDSLLPTIRSRCQSLRFAPVERDRIEAYLIDERAYSHDEARLAARLARGSIGRALSTDVKSFTEHRERMAGILRSAVLTHSREALIRASEELTDAKNKDRFEDDLDILESLIHDIWLLKTTEDEGRLVNADIAAILSQIAAAAEKTKLVAWLAEIEKLRADLVVNINRRVATDALFVNMAA